jgi:NADH-quinone oxidoreductase subunit M
VGVIVLVGGAATRLGAYLILRVLVAAEPDGARVLSPLIAALAAVTVAYAAIAAIRSTDLRHVGAYLALVPGGVTALGLAALTPLAITGSVLALFTGGMAAALIASVFTTVSERAQTRSVALLSGIAPRMPKLAWLTVLAALGLLGVPMMASFTSEVMTFFGAFKTQPVGAFAVAAGLALTAIALAVVVQRVLFAAPNPDAPPVSDASLGETWYLALLAGSLLWVGLVPGGPKLPGTDTPLFDPGLMNVMVADIPEIAAPYTGTGP